MAKSDMIVTNVLLGVIVVVLVVIIVLCVTKKNEGFYNKPQITHTRLNPRNLDHPPDSCSRYMTQKQPTMEEQCGSSSEDTCSNSSYPYCWSQQEGYINNPGTGGTDLGYCLNYPSNNKGWWVKKNSAGENSLMGGCPRRIFRKILSWDRE